MRRHDRRCRCASGDAQRLRERPPRAISRLAPCSVDLAATTGARHLDPPARARPCVTLPAIAPPDGRDRHARAVVPHRRPAMLRRLVGDRPIVAAARDRSALADRLASRRRDQAGELGSTRPKSPASDSAPIRAQPRSRAGDDRAAIDLLLRSARCRAHRRRSRAALPIAERCDRRNEIRRCSIGARDARSLWLRNSHASTRALRTPQNLSRGDGRRDSPAPDGSVASAMSAADSRSPAQPSSLPSGAPEPARTPRNRRAWPPSNASWRGQPRYPAWVIAAREAPDRRRGRIWYRDASPIGRPHRRAAHDHARRWSGSTISRLRDASRERHSSVGRAAEIPCHASPKKARTIRLPMPCRQRNRAASPHAPRSPDVPTALGSPPMPPLPTSRSPIPRSTPAMAASGSPTPMATPRGRARRGDPASPPTRR